MKYFSMFSGIGGFELGIQQAIPDAQCVGFSEVDKYAISIYKKHFKGHKNYGDATKIKAEKLPNFDCLVGGFPCQAFSIAGERKGFSDTRGTLFFEIARIAREKQPRVLVLENVKGLLSHDQGRSAAVILSTLDEIGYDVQWNVHNSKNYGVPQNRERVFIIGHLRASRQSTRKILAFRECNEKATGLSRQENRTSTITTKPGDVSRANTFISEVEISKIKHIGNINPSGNGANGNVFDVGGLCPTLTTNKGEGLKVIQLNQSNLKSNNGAQPFYQDRFYDPFGISPVLNTFSEPKVICFNGERGEESFTLTAQDRHGVLIEQRIRKLMPIECERLQGFFDNHTKFGANGELISDSQRYKTCGNGVTRNVAEWVFKELYVDF